MLVNIIVAKVIWSGILNGSDLSGSYVIYSEIILVDRLIKITSVKFQFYYPVLLQLF